jgi:hypothetical protein
MASDERTGQPRDDGNLHPDVIGFLSECLFEIRMAEHGTSDGQALQQNGCTGCIQC